MIVDLDRHVGVPALSSLFPYMTVGWQKHFDREEWVNATSLASSHVTMSDRFDYNVTDGGGAPVDVDHSLLLPYQGLTINGWADRVAAKAFISALNAYAVEHWASARARLAMLVSPHDPHWSAGEIRRHAQRERIGAVALPLTPEMLGSRTWDPIYEACVETSLPVVIHFSGMEGDYLGAPALSGGTHRRAFARLAVMPHLAESNITSLAFEGAYARFPSLQMLFSGFGFTWLPTLLWRMDREWRTFRHDVPWVKEPPSRSVLQNTWFTTWPLGEAADPENWAGRFSQTLRTRITFGSHAPHASDGYADVEALLGQEWADEIAGNGTAFISDERAGV